MSTKTIFIFIPNNLEKEKNGYLEGFYKDFDHCHAFYITNPSITKRCSNFIGYSGKHNVHNAAKTLYFRDKTVVVNGLGNHLPVTKVFYDYDCFNLSNVIEDTSHVYGKLFGELKVNLDERREKTNGHINFFIKIIDILLVCIRILLLFFSKFEYFIPFSATFSAVQESLKTLDWCLREIKRRKWSVAIGNVVFAKLIDLVLGIILVNYYWKHQCEIVDLINYTSQELVSQLKSLLLYLMGSPIGLKLNYAFNKSLGTFFFYHISLWRIFLNGLNPMILHYFHYLLMPCCLGLTFQLAMLSDIVAISTFHVYCIYVYAARMFHLQVKSLVALWRLLTGRKFNPLRERVDSCDYEQNQLFIGTLGFTIFLFLLPTTMMYYTVFVTFRIVLKIVEDVLSKIRHGISIFPLYGVVLWLANSRLITGSICIKWCKVDKDKTLNLEARLNKLQLGEIVKLVPVTTIPVKTQDCNVFPNVFTGVLM